MPSPTTRSRASATAQNLEELANVARETLPLISEIEREYGVSKDCLWRPFKGALESNGLKFSIAGDEHTSGTGEYGTLTVASITRKKNVKLTTETSQEVLKYDYEISLSRKNRKSKPVLEVEVKTDNRGAVSGHMVRGAWQQKLGKIIRALGIEVEKE